MHQKALPVVKGVGRVLAAGAATWTLSLMMQFIGARTTGQHFDPWGPPSSQLALMTIGMTLACMFGSAILAFAGKRGSCLAFLFWCVMVIHIGVGWYLTYAHAAPGTPISSLTALFIYLCIITAWGVVMWHVFLRGITDKIIDRD